jgi:protein AaeX
MGETNIFGVFFGGGLVAACLAAMVLIVLRRVLARVGFYTLVWNRPLVDVAFFALLWALMSTFVPRVDAVLRGVL